MLAFRADTTQSIVSAIERGTRGATRDMAERLARALASDHATAEEIERITADALLSAGFVPPGGLPVPLDGDALLGSLASYSGTDARLLSLKSVAELLHEGTASRPAATPSDPAASIERASPVVGKVPQGFRDFPLDVIEPALEEAIEEAENAFMHMFKSRVAFYLGKQPGGGVHEIAPVDRPVPPPSQRDYPMKNVLRQERAKRQAGSAGEKRETESGE